MRYFGMIVDQAPIAICSHVFSYWSYVIPFEGILENYTPPSSIDEEHRTETPATPAEIDDRPLWQQFTKYRLCTMLEAVCRWDVAYIIGTGVASCMNNGVIL